MNARVVPVVIVGAGPTGLTAATLLARYGVESTILERWDGIYPQPRAVHLDAEIHRILACLGVADEFTAISRPALGLRLVDRHLRVLAQFDRDPVPGRQGYPEQNLFDQPQLEALLRANLRRHPAVTLRGNAVVCGFTDESDCVRVDFTDRVTGEPGSVKARYVLGCDGANSPARAHIGATMRDLRFEQRWLVVDIATAAELDAWDGVHQLCDPARAGTYMRIGETRYRWEFRLRPGETADDFRDIRRLLPLISPWTKDVTADELELIRVAEYVFRAQIADRWRRGRVFLLGDAAHLTPPFIGQGMGAGQRDAMNLAWKLAGVVRGELPESVLDTYEAERPPHAVTMIRLAKLMGTVMTEGGAVGNALRRRLGPLLRRLPVVARHVTSGDTPPLHRSDLVVAPRVRRGLAGRLAPNAVLEDGRRLDDRMAGHFAIVTTIDPASDQRAEIERRAGVLVVAGPGGDLHRWLRRAGARAALIRPDGVVQRTGADPAELCAALPRFACGVAQQLVE